MSVDMELFSQERCQGIKTAEEMERLCKDLQPQIVEYMLSQYKSEILQGKTPSDDPTIYIIGGQNASGKSKLIETLNNQHLNSISIIIDDMKVHHPFRSYIDKNFPNESEELLHLACFEVFDRLLKELLEENYDITIERTLGSKEKMKRFLVEPSNYNYGIQIHVTATHEINSLLSALERFMYECKLKDEFNKKGNGLKIDPRPIGLQHHDDTYENICNVINSAENGDFVNSNGEHIYPHVFVWDRTPEKPTIMYETGDGKYTCAKQAMYEGRERDLKRCRSVGDLGYRKRVEGMRSELESAGPGDTLFDYKEYCYGFLSEIEKRGAKYIGEPDKNKS